MAKLKNRSSRTGETRLPSLSGSRIPSTSSLRTAIPKDVAGRAVNASAEGTIGQALNFGALHTKAKGSSGASSWGSLLSAATGGGGVSSALGGGLLSSGAFGFIGKLLNIFGGGKPTPSAPTPFVIPASQNTSLTVGSSSGSSSLLGVQANVSSGAHNGPIYAASNLTVTDHAQSEQVIHILRQALLTSSSLNDVISEI